MCVPLPAFSPVRSRERPSEAIWTRFPCKYVGLSLKNAGAAAGSKLSTRTRTNSGRVQSDYCIVFASAAMKSEGINFVPGNLRFPRVGGC